MDVREQITALREQLRYHNEKYYNEDAPEITDYEYDMLQRQLRTLEAEHPEMADATPIFFTTVVLINFPPLLWI